MTKRRSFLIGGAVLAGGGVFGAYLISSAASADKETALAGESLGGWLRISGDGRCTVFVPHIDMGQGVHTALAQMVADEMDLRWDQLDVVLAPTEHTFANGALARGWVLGSARVPSWLDGATDYAFMRIARLRDLQISGGSTAVRFTGQLGLRVVAANARQALLEAGARHLHLDVQSLTTSDGQVIHQASGKKVPYAQLAADAAQTGPRHPVRFKQPAQRRFVGRSAPRLDIPAKVDGTLKYSIDVDLPELRVATIRAAPVRGGSLVSSNDQAALAIAGVEKVVRLKDAVCVIGQSYWAVRRGLDAAKPEFSSAAAGSTDSGAIEASQLEALASGIPQKDFVTGDVAAQELSSATSGKKVVEATYHVPYLHHAAMEPLSITAHRRGNDLEVWAGVQDPLAARSFLAKVSKLSFSQVTLHAMPIGGGFGRRLPKPVERLLEQAVQVSAAVPHPVKLIWSREEDFAQGSYRPQLCAKLRGVLDSKGKILSWQNLYVRKNTEPDAAHIPYSIPHQSIRWVEDPSDRPAGPWRGVSHTQHTFYTESFIDELAHAASKDPLLFRLDHLPAGRARQVLERVAELAGWGAHRPPGEGIGLALGHGMGAVVAVAVRTRFAASKEIQVRSVCVAVDCGLVVNPDSAKQQVEGSIVMGLSAALRERITLEKGSVKEVSFYQYRLLSLAETPPIKIEFIGGEHPTGGLGEPSLPPVAPALANALFAASGSRSRRLPLQA